MKNIQKATIETNEDYNNVLDYLEEIIEQDRTDVVKLDKPYIITDEYEIEVKSEFLDIFDEIGDVFETVEKLDFNIVPKYQKITDEFTFNFY